MVGGCLVGGQGHSLVFRPFAKTDDPWCMHVAEMVFYSLVLVTRLANKGRVHACPTMRLHWEAFSQRRAGTRQVTN